MSSINDRLYQIYQDNQKGIDAIFARQKNGEPYLDGPHLLHCWEEYYRQSAFKILFLGQENFGWEGPAHDIDDQMGTYEAFEHAKTYKYRNGPYWRAVHSFNEQLNKATSHRLGFVASNVCKYCSDVPGPVTDEENRFVIQHLNLLPGELDILKPDVVLFFSGPKYDQRIAMQIGEEELTQEPIVAGIPTKELARIRHPMLPAHTYRTYHPNHLRYSRKWNFIRLIAATIAGQSIDAALLAYQQQMKELASELGLLLEEPDNFIGSVYAGHYFYRQEWRWCGIGFEFEANGAGSFFYGICRKDSTIAAPASVQEDLLKRLPAKEGSTEQWPWWRWSEHKDWSDQTMEEILNGTMKEKVRVIVMELLNRLDGSAI